MTFVSREKLFQTPVITGLVSQIDVPGSLFQRFYGLAGRGKPVQGRHTGWDLFHATRSVAGVRAPRSGPATRDRKPYGSKSAQLLRLHEKMVIFDEDLMRYRPAGAPIGSIDDGGKAYVRQQLGYFSQVFRNTREWVVSRMFRGGFGVKSVGDELRLCEFSDSDAIFKVDYELPAGHKDQLDVTGSGDIIDTSWDDASADIVSQITKLDVQAERVSGYPTRHIWLNGNTAYYLFENTQLASIRGTSVRIFDTLSRREIDPASKLPDTGYDIVFGAMPLHRFHVYNGGLVAPGTAENYASQIASANYQFFIPDNYAIITPEPSPDWCEMHSGSEYIRENVTSQMREVYGMNAWSTPVIDPPGQEVKMVDNFLPVLYIPRALFYAEVIF